jgi:hypothetical protein
MHFEWRRGGETTGSPRPRRYIRGRRERGAAGPRGVCGEGVKSGGGVLLFARNPHLQRFPTPSNVQPSKLGLVSQSGTIRYLQRNFVKK